MTALSFALAFAGFALLVILHELGHFSDLYKADAQAREQAAELIHGVTA